MVEPKHTAGPWVATNTGWGRSVIHRPDAPRDSDDYVIAYVPRGGVLELVDAGAANARLIAAAPELYEHALAVVRLFGTDHPKGIQELREAVSCLRQILKKADGEK